jgi:hypothetical protein
VPTVTQRLSYLACFLLSAHADQASNPRYRIRAFVVRLRRRRYLAFSIDGRVSGQRASAEKRLAARRWANHGVASLLAVASAGVLELVAFLVVAAEATVADLSVEL